jgi:hypothetical protein
METSGRKNGLGSVMKCDTLVLWKTSKRKGRKPKREAWKFHSWFHAKSGMVPEKGMEVCGGDIKAEVVVERDGCCDIGEIEFQLKCIRCGFTGFQEFQKYYFDLDEFMTKSVATMNPQQVEKLRTARWTVEEGYRERILGEKKKEKKRGKR